MDRLNHQGKPNVTPRLGCGAAIFDDDGALLLVRRLRAPEADCWGLPGGKVEWLEPTEDAVRREILEELDIEVRISGLLVISELIDMAGGAHWVAPVYRAEIVSGTPRLVEPHALSALDWFDRARLPAPLTIATQQLLDGLRTQ